MADRACVICGQSPVVETHLLPRAVALAIRGDLPALWLGSIHHEGYELSQSGMFDWLLCKRHEGEIGKYETYAIAFCRDLVLTPQEIREGAFAREGTDNDKLIRFACSVLWRFHASSLPAAKTVDLGAKWESILRAITFDNAPVNRPEMLVARYAPSRIPDDKWATQPSMGKFDGRRVWSFVIYGMVFMIKLDQQPFSPSATAGLLNGRDFVVGAVKHLRGDLPGMQAVTKRMTHPKRWNRPRR